MSAIHGVVSAVVPGLGQVIDGRAKDGAKFAGKNVAYSAIATGAAGALVATQAKDIATFVKVNADEATLNILKNAKDNVPSFVKKAAGFLSKNKKVAVPVAVAVGAAAGIASFVNYIKNIADAGKGKEKAE